MVAIQCNQVPVTMVITADDMTSKATILTTPEKPEEVPEPIRYIRLRENHCVVMEHTNVNASKIIDLLLVGPKLTVL